MPNLCQTQHSAQRALESMSPLSHEVQLGAALFFFTLDIQHVVEIGDVANSQSEDLDLGQFLVRGQSGQ